MNVAPIRPVWAEVDLAAITANASWLAALAHPARLCAVVKAGGYGHGAVPVARAALAGGATWLAVALVEEGRQLRQAGIEAPILLLSEPPPAAMVEVVAWGLTPTLYTEAGVRALDAAATAAAAAAAGAEATPLSEHPVPVHLKVDTGMHRVGARPDHIVELATQISRRPNLELQGLWTHFAVADEVGSSFTAQQLAVFGAAVDDLATAGIHPPILHTANSAAAIWHPASRLDMVRCGIALYGLSPSAAGVETPPIRHLSPALALKAQVSYVKELDEGDRLSYGLRFRLDRRSTIATVPLGYADGVPRRLWATGGEVLIGGRRYPIAGTISMDQLLVDCGPDADVRCGDEVVLLGPQGDETVTAWDWATRTDTIAYEVVCGVSGRVPRVLLGA